MSYILLFSSFIININLSISYLVKSQVYQFDITSLLLVVFISLWALRLSSFLFFRVKRTGQGMYDTSYSITATPKSEKIPEEKMAEVDSLPLIKDYFFERYGTFRVPEGGFASEDSEDDNLF